MFIIMFIINKIVNILFHFLLILNTITQFIDHKKYRVIPGISIPLFFSCSDPSRRNDSAD